MQERLVYWSCVWLYCTLGTSRGLTLTCFALLLLCTDILRQTFSLSRTCCFHLLKPPKKTCHIRSGKFGGIFFLTSHEKAGKHRWDRSNAIKKRESIICLCVECELKLNIDLCGDDPLSNRRRTKQLNISIIWGSPLITALICDASLPLSLCWQVKKGKTTGICVCVTHDWVGVNIQIVFTKLWFEANSLGFNFTFLTSHVRDVEAGCA